MCSSYTATGRLYEIPKSVTSLGLKKADIGTKLSPEAIGDLLACIAEGAEECLSNPEISGLRCVPICETPSSPSSQRRCRR